MKFKGRAIYEGDIEGEALVSKEGVNILATYFEGLPRNDRRSLDANNKYTYKKEIAGKILVVPECIGSTTGGMMLQAAAKNNLAPKAILFANHIDTLASAGIILAKVWEEKTIVAIDPLGPDILEKVETGDRLRIKRDGTVELI